MTASPQVQNKGPKSLDSFRQHTYKTQVYQLACHVGVPEAIIGRPPTSDTYCAECTQDWFFFRMPFELMDQMWYALEQQVPAEVTATIPLVPPELVERAYRDLAHKSRTTEYLRLTPLLIEASLGR